MAIIRLQGKREKDAGIYYEVDSSDAPIGEGGMGKVYRGKSMNARTGVTRPVAIKFLFMDLPDQAIERARREAGIHLRNDNLIEMLGFIETDEDRNGTIVKHYHVVSELLQGISLADLINGETKGPDGKPLPFAVKKLEEYKKNPGNFAKEIIKSVLSGLMALHDAGYIHRDIDPSNIFLTVDGHVKLIDFGICKQMKNLASDAKALTVAGVFMGKPEYASPELALGDLKHQNQTTDIYSVGVLMYQCLTGKVPFEGTRFDVLDKQIKAKLPLNDIINKDLRRIIARACEKRQELRYQTAAEMRVDLESIDVKRPIDPRRKRMYIILASVAVLLIAGAAIGFGVYRDNVEKKRLSLMEKAYTDSLTMVMNRSVFFADSLTKVGIMHDEGYDADLVEAKRQYLNAAAASRKLAAKNITTPDFSGNEAVLDSALNQAYLELSEKAEILSSDPDPIVAQEAGNIKKRAEAIQQIRSKK